MKLYLDTSLLVTALTREIETERIQFWLKAQDVDELCISDWVVAEFSAALSVKLRLAQLDPDMRAAALADFGRLVADSFACLPVTRDQFLIAARMADSATLGLRAGDALHLAVASDHGAVLCTRDKRLARAGIDLGIGTRLL